MFRDMRRKKQILSQEETTALLTRGSYGVLGVAGDEDYPYAVPLSYVYADSKIYFHCAKSGHKLDAIAKNNKVSFCVVDKNQIVPEEYTSYFRSAIVFGQARILEQEEEKLAALKKLALKYSPEQAEGIDTEIESQFKQVVMVEISIDHMSGKEAIELVRMRENSPYTNERT